MSDFSSWLSFIRKSYDSVMDKINGRKKLKLKSEFASIQSDSFKGQPWPMVVHYNYHRYFWNATEGKNKRKVMSHIILN